MMKRFFSYIICLVALTGLTGCHIYNKYQLPEGNAVVGDYAHSLREVPDSMALPSLGWEKVFTDPQLQTLIRAALANNKDLQNARLNIDIAQAQLKGAKLSYFPSLAFTPNGGSASYGGSHMNWTYQLPLSAQWEIDIFGKILNAKRQARTALEQSEDYAQAVRSQIVCGVATTYYSVVLLKQQLELTTRTADIWKDQVHTMELMKEAGSTNEAAVVQSRANYYNILSTIPDLEQQIQLMQTTLSLLVNTYPQNWDVNGSLDFSLPVEVKDGMTLNYLAARPDVRAAERAFASAYYATNSARAAFYPSLVISGTGGFTNLLGSLITNPGKWFIQVAGSLTAPIFSRGQNIARLEAAKAQQQQALNSFQYAVLGAAADVSDAMVKINKNAEKGELVGKQIQELEKAVEYTQTLFMVGRGTYLELLTARSSLLSAQLSGLACRHARVSALISLYQAVGGGR